MCMAAYFLKGKIFHQEIQGVMDGAAKLGTNKMEKGK